MTTRELILSKLASVGWTQADLARATNIPKQNLGPILSGKRPLLAWHVFAIDNVLNLGLDYGACAWPESTEP